MNKETLLWIFCIIVLLGLTSKVSVESNSFDCSMCTIDFYNTAPFSNQKMLTATESVTNLIESYKGGQCLFGWDPTQGYYRQWR